MNFSLSNNITDRMKKYELEEGIIGKIIEINPDLIDTWIHRDRKDFEVGDIDELSRSIILKGQAQPIIVVKRSSEFEPKNNHEAKYVVIAGYRRWLACKKINKKIQAVVSDMTFEQAVLCLVAENEKENVSEYSKGMFYDSILKTEKITQDQLSKKIGLAPTSLKNYLSFSRVPDIIWKAVSDLSNVSSRTSAEIASLSAKGKEYIDALLSVANEIRNGYGEKRIKNLVHEYLSKSELVHRNKNSKVLYNEKHIMTLYKDKITFTKNVTSKDNFDKLQNKIQAVVTDWMKNNDE